MKKQQQQPRETTVAEAGAIGGQTTRDRHGPAFYQQIGRKGGKRVQELIAAGRLAEAQDRVRETKP